jgi:hypothetical protein
MLERGLAKFEREGLWLLLSLHHYGWRGHADMAAFLVGAADPLEFGEHHLEHRAMAALEELFLLLDGVVDAQAADLEPVGGEGEHVHGRVAHMMPQPAPLEAEEP